MSDILQQHKISSTAVTGFASFGLLLGYLTGLTSSEIAQTIITALFAFLGGKLFNDLSENPGNSRNSGKILLGFSILFFIGLNLGILVKTNRWLTFVTQSTSIPRNNAPGGETKNEYLRNIIITKDLETKFRNQELTIEEKDSLIGILFSQNK